LVSIQSTAGSFQFRTNEIAYGVRVSIRDGEGYVDRLPLEQKWSEAGYACDYPALTVVSDGTRWIAWLAHKDKADEVMVSNGSKVFHISGRGDLHAPAIASDGKDRVQVVWPGQENGTFYLYGSVFRNGSWSKPGSKPEKLAAGGGNNLAPQLASDGLGHMALVWQGFRNRQSVALARLWNGNGWTTEQVVSEGSGNSWAPSAAYGGGKLWLAWGSYASGAYQIYARE